MSLNRIVSTHPGISVVQDQTGVAVLKEKEVALTAADAIPAGVIVMWSGLLAAIPSGWALCNGANGTPDLRDRFILGAGIGEDPGDTGGARRHRHTFTGDTSSTEAITAGTPAGTNSVPTFTGNALGTHSHGVGTYANTAASGGIPAGTIAWPAGVPTAASESTHTHASTGLTFTGDAVAAASTNATPDLVAPDATGTGVSPVTTATGTIGGSTAAGSAHTHTIAWPAGVPTFTGSSLSNHNHTFSGTSEAVSAGTPSGTVSAPVFTGTILAPHSHNFTPTGIIDEVDNYPLYFKLAFIMKLAA